MSINGKKRDVLQIVKEDILEFLKREDKKLPVSSIEPEIKVSDSLISEALQELKKEELVETEENLFFLTNRGSQEAEKIVEKHSVLEDYFKKIKVGQKARKAASILEHYISTEVLDGIKKLSTLKKEGEPLTRFKKEEVLIADIVFDDKLFERIVSMGIFPGVKIIVESELPHSMVIRVGNKKIALAKKLAERIKVIHGE